MVRIYILASLLYLHIYTKVSKDIFTIQGDLFSHSHLTYLYCDLILKNYLPSLSEMHRAQKKKVT